MPEFISTERDGMVAVVTIDHPPVNALSAPLLEELEEELVALDADEGVRAIVLKGAGERAFVAGADISEFPSLREAAPQQNGGSARGIQKLGHRMDAAHTPFVAEATRMARLPTAAVIRPTATGHYRIGCLAPALQAPAAPPAR